MSSITYRPEIDGLRAVAVIPVILFHIDTAWLPGGYTGVDVFFVISGFLITSIILDEYKRGIFSFTNFWLRRVRRILPVLIAMVLTTLVVGEIVLYGPDMNDLGNQGVASLLSFANISHWLITGNYWGHTAESSALLHTWSLSVEEQFYLFFPVMLVITLKYFHKWVTLTLLVLSSLSVLLFFYGAQYHPSATFYLLPTRAWELGVGALVAIAYSKKTLIINKKPELAVIGLSAIILSYFLVSG
ncbi:MAG: acyltransferase, partial [Gammaproteobacteria bacterium]